MLPVHVASRPRGPLPPLVRRHRCGLPRDGVSLRRADVVGTPMPPGTSRGMTMEDCTSAMDKTTAKKIARRERNTLCAGELCV